MLTSLRTVFSLNVHCYRQCVKLCFPASASARFAASLRSDAALGRTAAAQSVNDLQLCVYNMPAAGTVLRSVCSNDSTQQNIQKRKSRINQTACKIEPLLSLFRSVKCRAVLIALIFMETPINSVFP